jgi:hypothetical protein
MAATDRYPQSRRATSVSTIFFVALEARCGRGRERLLRDIRRRPSSSRLDRPLSPVSGQLALAA